MMLPRVGPDRVRASSLTTPRTASILERAANEEGPVTVSYTAQDEIDSVQPFRGRGDYATLRDAAREGCFALTRLDTVRRDDHRVHAGQVGGGDIGLHVLTFQATDDCGVGTTKGITIEVLADVTGPEKGC